MFAKGQNRMLEKNKGSWFEILLNNSLVDLKFTPKSVLSKLLCTYMQIQGQIYQRLLTEVIVLLLIKC